MQNFSSGFIYDLRSGKRIDPQPPELPKQVQYPEKPNGEPMPPRQDTYYTQQLNPEYLAEVQYEQNKPEGQRDLEAMLTIRFVACLFALVLPFIGAIGSFLLFAVAKLPVIPIMIALSLSDALSMTCFVVALVSVSKAKKMVQMTKTTEMPWMKTSLIVFACIGAALAVLLIPLIMLAVVSFAPYLI